MSITKAIGKNTLGGGKKMNVDLKTYSRSSHNLSNVWRSSMSPGTLVPFMSELALPGDVFDINLEADVMTHPTVGPLFGSYKLQLDVFTCPIRLYNSALHNNRLGIGLDMAKVKLPKIIAEIRNTDNITDEEQWSQCNPSCLLAYLGIKGFGQVYSEVPKEVKKNGIPILAYWDIFKNYYANKQEDKAYYIGKIPYLEYIGIGRKNGIAVEDKINKENINLQIYKYSRPEQMEYMYFSKEVTYEMLSKVRIRINTAEKGETQTTKEVNLSHYYNIKNITNTGTHWRIELMESSIPSSVDYVDITWFKMKINSDISMKSFDLKNIDIMRDEILSTSITSEFRINGVNKAPYNDIVSRDNGGNEKLMMWNNQYGLALKTYQSDLMNNWINTEWIDGSAGISQLTAIDTSTGKFTLDTLNLAKKVYDMLNRIAVSGGTYRDWIETVYTNEYVERSETPVYEGGLSQEIVFQEVISTAANGDEPLGSLAGRGRLHPEKKGGKIHIKIEEPSYILGIVSITPRIDYNQGNKWDTNLDTLNDLHKPQLDGIGYQDLITEWGFWGDVDVTSGTPVRKAVGKQPAWVQYMTAINETYGNFAMRNAEGFMVLNRDYEWLSKDKKIADFTTYINPKKFNYIFADTRIDAMNFWVQIGKDIVARRKMSAKIIPNL